MDFRSYGIVAFLAAVLLFPGTALAAPGSQVNCRKITGTCATVCGKGLTGASGSDFLPGDTNDCPTDPITSTTQACCIPDGSGCSAAGGSCTDGFSCVAGKVSVSATCKYGKICCADAASSVPSTSGPSCASVGGSCEPGATCTASSCVPRSCSSGSPRGDITSCPKASGGITQICCAPPTCATTCSNTVGGLMKASCATGENENATCTIAGDPDLNNKCCSSIPGVVTMGGGTTGSTGSGGSSGSGATGGAASGASGPLTCQDTCTGSHGDMKSSCDTTDVKLNSCTTAGDPSNGMVCCVPSAVATCATSGGKCAASCSASETASTSCMNKAGEKCCVPTKASATGAATGGLKAGSAGGLPTILAACAQSGDCTLNDIVNTGANAANFFTVLSAGLFFFSFIYGGARYLLSFGRKEWVTAGTKAMTTSALGMAIVMFAWVIVNYVANAIQGKG